MSEAEQQVADTTPSVVEAPVAKPASETVENGHVAAVPDEADANGQADHADDDGEESDDYDYEEEQQAVEGEDDEYEDEDDVQDAAEENGVGGSHQNGKSSLTALLLGDHTISGNGDDEVDDDEVDDEDDEDYQEPEPTPITPTTSKKRSIDEALEDAASPREENESKKAKA